ncbi:pseudouridine-5'-phosphate glycosidase [Lentzea sp. DG1S-22]|uniref:pseudouridine-5'-phosphate glycosidase n=1 Tax=unclassified Lentzea TaxID=2643253 RepID=UPI0027DF7EB5|nr:MULTISPECIES: pseudouridine-5'-phosphate glycosidase [unclassified Lentzea]MCG8923837.1 pseudouridine-5'-phosphate glycosidase [Lentzea sp. CC55]WVH84535.1 pseudouridine-5'-phosphate glycosidase [Lentzea sp. DG1S-22]
MTTLHIADEVASALAENRPVVALESTILSHGLPAPRNLAVAARLEEVVRKAGAVPATIAVLDGVPHIGLTSAELDRVCTAGDLVKLSLRDLGPAYALGRSGATTVASTTALAHQAGIRVFGTGGLGGVHRGARETWDVSADLDIVASTPVVVVCSGVKSILDMGATLEVLETRSVPVVGYRTSRFPAFYRRESEFDVPWRVETPAEAAAVFAAGGRGMLLVNPIPADFEMDADLHDRLLAEGLQKLVDQDVRGKDVTPVLLEHFHTASAGVSLDANEELVVSNVSVAAAVAVELSR